MRVLLKTIVVAIALLVGWQIGRSPGSPGSLTEQTSPPPTTSQRTSVPQAQFRGMAIQLHGGPDVFDRYQHLVPQVAELGANTVLFVVHGWQDHAGSMDLRIDANKTAHAEELGRLCDHARRQGLRTIVMPIVLLANPRNTEWRGRIIPPNHDWDGWFRRYREFILHFAKIADRHNVDVFMVGSELIKSESSTRRWQALIKDIRKVYSGKLGYSANWDHYQTHKIRFWPDLDYIGMTTYYQLADGPNPSPEELDHNWRKFKREILAFQGEVNRPIIFTEVGWCSQEGAAKEGWNYYANRTASKSGQIEQARLYESFLRTWAKEPAIGGIIWWEWDTSEGGPKDFGYTPRGKPAEAILREWLRTDCAQTADSGERDLGE